MAIKSALLALAFLAAATFSTLNLASAADAPDPAVGTWKLNLDKSKPDASMPVKSAVRTYSPSEGGLTVSQTTVDANGASHESGSSFTYDGKQHPVHGVSDYDMVAVKRVGSHESKSELYRDGKRIGHLTRTVSKDGKILTVTSDLTGAKGNKIHDVAVYDRQ